jgi:hypothetical protein
MISEYKIPLDSTTVAAIPEGVAVTVYKRPGLDSEDYPLFMEKGISREYLVFLKTTSLPREAVGYYYGDSVSETVTRGLGEFKYFIAKGIPE